jgi:hypothetical protein
MNKLRLSQGEDERYKIQGRSPLEKDPPKKKMSKSKKHHQEAELVPTKLKKYVAALLFRLAAATGIQNWLIMKNVCFLTDDGEYGQKLVEHFGGVGRIEKSWCSIDGNLYLFGNIVSASKLPKKGNANVVAYDMQWEDLVVGKMKIDLEVVMPAIELLVRMQCVVRRWVFLGRSIVQRSFSMIIL